jgi:hypothetical protein
MQFVFVEHMDTVLAEALFPPEAKASLKARPAAEGRRSGRSPRVPPRPRARA